MPEATIPELFAARVASAPDAPAVIWAGHAVSYAELDRRANRVAWALHHRGVRVDTPVGVAMPRGVELVVALLGVVKAGGAYVPIDPESPAARMASVLGGAGVRLLLTDAITAPRLPRLDRVAVLPVDQIPDSGQSGSPPRQAHPTSLAYISHTSGSTGVPKGVAIPHRAVARLVREPNFASLGPGERVLHLAPVAFDASTLEIWGALLTGAAVVVAPPAPLGLVELAALLRTTQVTVAWFTAGMFHQLVEADAGALAEIGQVLAGGDVLRPDAVRAALRARSGKPVVNGYGPTENTTFTTCHRMTDPEQVDDQIPIGRPIQQTTVRILDSDGWPTPAGEVGELCAGGDGLARGYVGNPRATARSFVPDPHRAGQRLYRTGDLVRQRADGALEFVGRVDDQVKIRGFRVEPGEAAAALRAHPGVRDAVVTVRGEGADRYLAGYVIAAPDVDPAALRPDALRAFLSDRLPDYLVPAGFARLERLPLSPNGKVDRAALPPPEREGGTGDPPRTATERHVADMWSRLLPADRFAAAGLGRDDSFFTLGGNSLTATRLLFRIREAFGVELGFAEFYRSPTVAACAAMIEAAGGGTAGGKAAGGGAAGGGARVSGSPAGGITRRDRGAFRVAAGAAAPAPRSASASRPELPPHLIRLGGDWALWRTVCLRGAGFPMDLLDEIADKPLAAAADRVLAARAGETVAESAAETTVQTVGDGAAAREQAEVGYAAEFEAAVRRLGIALYDRAGQPAFREAIAWQNRHALTTGIDALRRHDPAGAARNSKRRQHEALVASYLQRYCAKNDTIGFFGPVGWAHLDGDAGISLARGAGASLIAQRRVYLEGWAVTAFMAEHEAALRPWLTPRRMPFIDIDDNMLRLPLAAPMPVGVDEAAVLRACDGVRDATQVAAAVIDDPATSPRTADEVFALIAELSAKRRLAWRLEVAPGDIHPERTVRAILDRVTDPAVQEPALTTLAELTAARDALTAAAGDAQRVAAAMSDLETAFRDRTGLSATRRAGATYAGRTLAFEECLRADDVRIGADVLDGIREPLSMVLDSARWYTTVSGALFRQEFAGIYRRRAAELGSDLVPFADFWLLANDLLFHPPERLTGPLVGLLAQRWASVLDLPAGQRRVRLTASALRDRVAAAFPADAPGWVTAAHHSPDLMIRGASALGDVNGVEWILGELHPGLVTTRYASWVVFTDRDAMAAGLVDDLDGRGVFLAETAEEGGISARLSNALASPDDLRLVFAHDSCGHDPRISLPIGACDLVDSPTGLRVRRRDGRVDRDLMDVLGDLISAVIVQKFRIVAPAPHTPRVTIDNLVVNRESWTFPAVELRFAGTSGEAERFLQARGWAAGHGIGRYAFVRCTGEQKPIFIDFTSLASVDLLARAVRRSCRHSETATVTVVEMLPTPDDMWLVDARGRRYASELRMVAADRRQKG